MPLFQNMTGQKKTALAFSAVLAAGGFGAYLLVFALSRFVTACNVLIDGGVNASALPENACLTLAVYSYLLFAVYIRLFIRYGTAVRENWLAEHPGAMTAKQTLTAMLRSAEFWAGACVVFLLGSLPLNVKDSVVNLVRYGENVNYSAHRTEEFLEYVPFYILVYTLLSFTSRRDWLKRRTSFLPGKAGMKKDLKRFFGYFALYTVILVFGTQVLATGAMAVVVFLIPAILIGALLVGLISLLPASFRLIRGFFRRRKFFAELNRLCCEHGRSVGKPVRPYLSLITHPEGKTLSVSTDGKAYGVKLLSIPDGFATALFSPGGTYAVTHRVGISKLTFFTFVSEYRYAFEQEELPGTPTGKYRHLILLPTLPGVYVTDEGVRVPVDNGSIVGPYRLWTPDAFLRALGRGVLDKV